MIFKFPWEKPSHYDQNFSCNLLRERKFSRNRLQSFDSHKKRSALEENLLNLHRIWWANKRRHETQNEENPRIQITHCELSGYHWTSLNPGQNWNVRRFSTFLDSANRMAQYQVTRSARWLKHERDKKRRAKFFFSWSNDVGVKRKHIPMSKRAHFWPGTNK